ncbi:MAG: hypothetical protein KBT88_01205 [Gammaproteobacteria bacterium]|nr:hypothetical protein [Gammaproteobacteria bacterium]MBQ0838372.1 hypothetical protein [Gammaproteobacteria bacterium]
MDRRNFIRLAFGGAVAGIVAPQLALASAPVKAPGMAGGLYFTKDAPGRWSKKVGGHLPNIEVATAESGAVLKIVTAHSMDSYVHYIVKHIVLDKDFNFIAEHMFDPSKDNAAISEIAVGGYRGVVNVLSVCNKHDTWLNTAEV